MRHTRLVTLAFAFLLSPAIAFASERIDPNDPPHGRFIDEWSEVYMNGAKVGYSHSAMTREGGRVHTSMVMHLELGRVGSPVGIDMTQETTESVQGVPVDFESKQDMSMMTMATKGHVRDGKVTVIQSQYGMEQKQTFDFPKGALMSWGLFRESLVQGFEPGTRYLQKVYEPGLRLDDAITASTTVGKREAFEKYGKKYSGIRVAVVMRSPLGEMEMVSWVDDSGSPVMAQVPMPGLGNLEIMAADEKAALSDFVPPELFLATTIKANRSFDAKSARKVKYRLRSKIEGQSIGELPGFAAQTVVVNDDGSTDVTVTRIPHRATKRTPLPAKDGLADYLDGNLMINIDDPQLRSLSRQACGNEQEPFALADKLRRLVTDYVKSKSLNIGFATASEVCRNREGDCSEHGVLLAALGRLCGLPSRVAVGVVYMRHYGGQSNVLGYHMWTQFFIDGRWIDVDAALRETDCSPTRIAFATSSLKNTGMADLSLPLINKIGAIDVEIVEIEPESAER